MKEEESEVKEGRRSSESDKSITSDASAIGIRPKPVIRKPENVSISCKSEPIETKWHWAPGAWQDATRTSAFQPYKVFLSRLTSEINICMYASCYNTGMCFSYLKVSSKVEYLSYLILIFIYWQPPTLLTNLQRGNTQTQIPQLYVGNDITFHTLAGQGELGSEHMQPSKSCPSKHQLTVTLHQCYILC